MTFAAIATAAGDAIFAKVDGDLTCPVGDGGAPTSPGTPPLYAVVDQMDGTVRSDLDQAYNVVKHVVQVRSVGATRNAAQWVQDRVRTSLLDGTLTIVGASLLRVELEVGGRVAREDDADPTSLFVGFDRFAFHLDTRS